MTAPKRIAPVVTFNPLEIEAYRKNASDELNAAKQLAITSAEDEAQWAEQLKEIRRSKDRLEALKQSVTKPLNEALKNARALFKDGEAALEALDEYVATAISRYRLGLAKAREEQFALAAKAADEGDGQTLTKALNTAQATQPQKVAGLSVVMRWVAKVTGKVPYEWTIPDSARLQKYAASFDAQHPPTPIEGVEFELEASARVRR